MTVGKKTYRVLLTTVQMKIYSNLIKKKMLLAWD